VRNHDGNSPKKLKPAGLVSRAGLQFVRLVVITGYYGISGLRRSGFVPPPIWRPKNLLNQLVAIQVSAQHHLHRRISPRGHGLKLLHSPLRFNLVWFLHNDSPFLGKRKLLLAYQGCERGVATFYDLPGIPCSSAWPLTVNGCCSQLALLNPPSLFCESVC